VGVKGGDWVWVESAKGRVRLKAKLYTGTLPEIVHIPLFGGEGAKPNDLIANETDPFRGFGLLNTTRIRLLKA
jgi:anaerobic selenocysteine-containing dehydrogenase